MTLRIIPNDANYGVMCDMITHDTTQYPKWR